MITNITANDTFKMLTEDILQKRLFASESLLVLREKWFSSHKFFASTPILDKKYKHPRFKYKNSFYLLA